MKKIYFLLIASILSLTLVSCGIKNRFNQSVTGELSNFGTGDSNTDDTLHIHRLVEIKKNEATCHNNGNIAHFLCFDCGKLYTDKTGTIEVSEADVLTTTTHSYVDDECAKCGEHRNSECLKYALNEDKTAYTVIGTSNTQILNAIIPSVHNSLPVTSIGEYAFSECKQLNTVNFGNNVEQIGKGAFKGCESLVSLTIPDNITNIAEEAFAECSSLSNISLGMGLTQIGANAFYGTIPHQIARGDIADPSLGADAEPVKQDIFYLGNWLIASLNSEIFSFTIKEGTVGIADSAFQSCKSLVNISIPNVKYIGNASFAFCDELRNVYKARDVLVINDYAFYECAALVNVDKSVELKVQKIGNSAFENCSLLEDSGINIPAYPTLKYLGENAFLGTTPSRTATPAEPFVCLDSWVVGFREGGIYMSQVNVPDVNKSNGKPITAIGNYAFQNAIFMGGGIWVSNNVVYIGRGAFYNLYLMGSVGGAANLEYIDDYAFYGCSSAYLFTDKDEPGVAQLPPTLKYIGDSAFYECINLIGVKFSENLEYIGPYAFYGCYNLGDSGKIWNSEEDKANGMPALKGYVKFASGSLLSYLGDSAFAACTGIKELTLPNSLERIGKNAFCGCDNISIAFHGENNESSNYKIVDGSLYSKDDKELLYYSNTASSFTIPDSVEIIHIANSNLSSIEVSAENANYISFDGNLYSRDGRTLIAYASGKLESSFTVPKSVKYIDSYSFANSQNLTEINLHKDIISIGNYAFLNCNKIKKVTLTENITNIGLAAFFDCASLEEINFNTDVLNDSHREVFSSLGNNGNKLKVIIGNNVTAIPNYFFKNAKNISSVEFEKGSICESIGIEAFANCESITSITIPDSVTSIGNYAFIYCFSLTSVSIGNGVTSIGDSAFNDCYELTSVSIGNGVTSIGNYAFSGCDVLTSVTIPDSVTSIGNYAFSGCIRLTSVSIGNGVTSIGGHAFAYCSKLTNVYYTGSEEEWNAISIDYYNDNLNNATRYYYSENAPTTEGNFWHYDENGDIVIW